MLDHIIVEVDGVKMPLNHLAVVSVLDSKTLSVNPYDPNVMTKTLLNEFAICFNTSVSSLACVIVSSLHGLESDTVKL